MKSSVAKVKKRITEKENKSSNIENYDSDNLYPQRVKDIILSSGTAKSCVRLMIKHIMGEGFTDKIFYKSKVNRNDSADALLRGVCFDTSFFGGRAYHIQYNGMLEIISVERIPFENCRLGIEEKTGKIAVYDDWECISSPRIDNKEIKWFDKYTSKKDVIFKQIQEAGGLSNFGGHIWYRPLSNEYPLSPIDSVLEDVISDKGIKDFRKSEISTGFMPSHMVEYGTKFEDDEAWEAEISKWKEFQGTENAGKIICMENDTDKPIKITKIDLQNNDKIYEVTNRTVKDSIIESMSIPPVLLGVAVAGKLGNTKEISEAYKFYNSITYYERLEIEEEFKELFSKFYYKINPSDDYSIIPLTYGSGDSIIQRFGVEETKTMLELVKSDLDSNQKINILQFVFGLSIEESQKIIIGQIQ